RSVPRYRPSPRSASWAFWCRGISFCGRWSCCRRKSDSRCRCGLSLLGLGSTFLVDDQLWMVAATLAVIPPLAFFLILQRPYLRGLETLSGLKEWHAPPRGLATCAQMGQDGADVASYGSPGADRVHRRRLVGDVCPPALAYHLPAGRSGGRR